MTDTLSVDSLEKMGFIETYFLYLTGNTSETRYKLETPLTNVISVEVNSALIPRSEYTIEPERNSLYYSYVGESRDPIHIPARDYDSTDLIQRLKDSFLDHDQIEIEVIEGTGRFRFYNDSNAEFSFDMKKSSCRRVLGFEDLVYESISINGRNVIEAPFRYNLMGTECILMESDLDSQINHSKVNSISAPLAKFYVSDSSRSQFVQLINHEQGSRHFFPISKLSNLNVNFRRGHMEPNETSRRQYDFHGVTYYVHIVVKCISYGKNWGTLGSNKISNDAEYVLKGLIDFLLKEKEKEKEKENEKEKETPNGSQNRNILKTFGLISALGVGYWGYNKLKPGSNIDVNAGPIDFDF